MADEIYQITTLDGTVHDIQDKAARESIPTKISQLTDDVGLDNTLTDEQLAKINSVETGAQANVIESVSVDGTALTPADKNVNIDLSSYAKSADFTLISNEDVDKLIANAFADDTEDTSSGSTSSDSSASTSE